MKIYCNYSFSTDMQKQTKHHKTDDAIIRKYLKEYLAKAHKDDKRVRTVDELGINHGDVRADIAVVNGVFHGYEIKSDLDTLNRLPRQAEAYSEVFVKVRKKGNEVIDCVVSALSPWLFRTLLLPDGADEHHRAQTLGAGTGGGHRGSHAGRASWFSQTYVSLYLGVLRSITASDS